jgi:hypothetical protein
MFWDILVASGIGITQLVLTWYGVYVSVAEHRIRNAIFIGVVGFVGVGLTIVGVVRNSIEQGELRTELGEIKKNTRLHGSIKIEPKANSEALPLPLSDTRPLRLNFMYLNIGNQEAKNDKLFAQSFLEYGNPGVPATVENVWAKFSQYIRNTDNKHLPGGGMSFGIPFFSTNEPPFTTLTGDQIKDIGESKAHIFLAVSMPFEDDRGKHVQEACFWIQQPATPASPWHDCGIHDTEITLP